MNKTEALAEIESAQKENRRADLREADLRGVVLSGVVLSGADLRDAVLIGADLRRADLREAVLSGAFLNGALLSGADLSLADLWDTTGNGKEVCSMQTDIWTATWTIDTLQIGCQRHAIGEWWGFGDDEIAKMEDRALDWWRRWKPCLEIAIANTVGTVGTVGTPGETK